MTAATPDDIITVTREPASFEFESSTHLLHAACTTAQLVTLPAARISLTSLMFDPSTTISRRAGDVKPEPEVNCGDKERRTILGDKLLHDVRT